MALDFRASQFRGAKFISSGSTGTGAKILFYDIAADSTTTPNIGVINTAKFNTASIGTDVFLYVSGGIGQAGTPNANSVTVFGGDVVVSGNLTLSGSLLSEVWVDGGGKTYTTSSVAITRDATFATNYGSDVYFYVSGTINGNSTANFKTVLPDVIMSGNLWFKTSSLNSISIIYNPPRTGGIILSTDMYVVSTGKIVETGNAGDAGPSDAFLFVSGNANSKYLGTGKTTVFGGDIVSSGSMFLNGDVNANGGGANVGLFFRNDSNNEDTLKIETEDNTGWSIAVSGTASPQSLTISSNNGMSIFNNGTSGVSSIAMNNNFAFSGTGGITASSDMISLIRLRAAKVSGSLQRLTTGEPYLTGSGFTFNTNSLGQVVITGSYKTFMPIGSYVSTTLTSSNPQVAGQAVLSQSELPNTDIRLRSILATTSGSATASLSLYNLTSGSYVHIGGAGITTLTTLNTTPTPLTSVNLLGATNFGTGSSVYEVQVYIQTGSQQAILGSSMFVCS